MKIKFFAGLFFNFILSIPISHAQIKQGAWLAGGSFTGNHVAQERFANTRVGFNPLFARFTNRNLCLGIIFPVEYEQNNYKNFPLAEFWAGAPNNLRRISRTQRTTWAVSPFLRKYFGKGRLLPFLQAALSYDRVANTKAYVLPSAFAFTSLSASVGMSAAAGCAYRIGDRLMLEGTAGYGRRYQLTDFSNPASDFRLGIGLAVLISRE